MHISRDGNIALRHRAPRCGSASPRALLCWCSLGLCWRLHRRRNCCESGRRCCLTASRSCPRAGPRCCRCRSPGCLPGTRMAPRSRCCSLSSGCASTGGLPSVAAASPSYYRTLSDTSLIFFPLLFPKTRPRPYAVDSLNTCVPLARLKQPKSNPIYIFHYSFI